MNGNSHHCQNCLALAVYIWICGLVATLANFELVDKVNDKFPKEEQFALLGWYWSSATHSITSIRGCILRGAFS